MTANSLQTFKSYSFGTGQRESCNKTLTLPLQRGKQKSVFFFLNQKFLHNMVPMAIYTCIDLFFVKILFWKFCYYNETNQQRDIYVILLFILLYY